MDENVTESRKSAGLSGLHSRYFVSEFFIALALVFFTAMNIIYVENRSVFQTSNGSSSFYPDVTLLLLLVGVAFLATGAASFLRIEAKQPIGAESDSIFSKSIGGIVADTVSKYGRIVIVVAAIYGAIFALLDGILIYQPTVNFASVYGFSSPGVVVADCCGPPGYVPVGLMYFPAEHLGIQLIPISVLIMILVSLLVGVNAALLLASVEKSRPLKLQKRTGVTVGSGGSSFLSGVLGAAFGVFAGCPTCAAAFFLSMIAGSGATAFSLIISEFQPAIILISIPLLFGSILWQAKSIRKVQLGCPI